MTAEPYSLWRLELLTAILPLTLAFLGCAGATLLGGRWLLKRIPRIGPLRLNDLGTSELEFALAFPFFLMMVLTTVQMALLINATLVVDYAAFCTARSAVVWLPQELPGEGANAIADPARSDSEKWTRIRRAATLAAVPISPRASSILGGVLPSGVSAAIDASGLGQLASSISSGGSVDYARLSRDMLDKWPYASLFTTVELLDAGGAARSEFPADSAVTARVTHNFYMNVPFAGAALGAALGRRYGGLIGPYYVPVSASYTLMMARA